jgi:predicted RNase H-like HicB family nuclease
LEDMTYQAVFEQADDESVFVYVPDLPGCTSWAATMNEAREHVRDAIGLWLAVARENGEDAPVPWTIASAPIAIDAK